MNSTDFNWGDDVIDSRDIIARYEELKDEKDSLEEALKEAKEALVEYNKENPDGEDPSEVDSLVKDIENANIDLATFNTFEGGDDFELLEDIIRQGEDCSDWSDGEGLIHENHFTQYIKELIDDCYEMPSEFTDGKWPFNHMEMDWESAAEEAKADYSTIEAGGETYYIRA